MSIQNDRRFREHALNRKMSGPFRQKQAGEGVHGYGFSLTVTISVFSPSFEVLTPLKGAYFRIGTF